MTDPRTGGNVEYPAAVCEWDTDQGQPCLKPAVAKLVVGGVPFEVCEEHRRWLDQQDLDSLEHR